MIDKNVILKNLGYIEEAIGSFEKNPTNPSVLKAVIKIVLDAQREVNRTLFATNSFSELSLAPEMEEAAWEQGSGFFEGVMNWFEFVMETLNDMGEIPINMDGEFFALMNYFKRSSEKSLLCDIKYNFASQEERVQYAVCRYFNAYSYFWGALDPANNVFEVIEDRISVIKNNEKDIEWLYHRFDDYRSKNVFLRFLRNWITFSIEELVIMKEPVFSDYYDLDILKCTEDEVLVDCGAYTGDSAISFIDTYKNYRKIYCYEASERNFLNMKNNLNGYENIVMRPVAVGEDYGTIMISDDESSSTVNRPGKYSVEVVPIDEDINEPVSIIKMDIEGAEQTAIKGAVGHIKKDRPRLLLSVYHGNHDIVEIPRMIESIRDDYKFYLRYNGQGAVPSEIIFFAV